MQFSVEKSCSVSRYHSGSEASRADKKIAAFSKRLSLLSGSRSCVSVIQAPIYV